MESYGHLWLVLQAKSKFHWYGMPGMRTPSRQITSTDWLKYAPTSKPVTLFRRFPSDFPILVVKTLSLLSCLSLVSSPKLVISLQFL